jgi:sugar/nucleoside kinase (ribokinase family)
MWAGQYTTDSRSNRMTRKLVSDGAIEVLHVGSASRDLTDDDPRGWRLGGGVTYSALTTARLGLRTAAIVGADAVAAEALELDLLRDAGVEVRIVPLAASPVFRNRESPDGRTQTCLAPGQRLPALDVPIEWSAANAWSIVPVAAEIGDDWAPAVPEDAFVAIGWQGWLRRLGAGRKVARRPPSPSALLRRANLVGVSRHDLAPATRLADLRSWLRPDASLLVTDGERGGQLLRAADDGASISSRYAAIPADVEVDPTGAGDTFLGALVAAFVQPSIAHDGGPAPESALALAAAAASLVIEQEGLFGVPDLEAVTARLQRMARLGSGGYRPLTR